MKVGKGRENGWETVLNENGDWETRLLWVSFEKVLEPRWLSCEA
jgi:hypothetical protein